MKINYVIGRYWDRKNNNQVCVYTDHNMSVFFDEEKEAYKHAKYISNREGNQYRVFKLIDSGTYYDDDPC